MKKLLFVLINVLIVGVTVFAQSSTVKDDANGFSFNAPSGWVNQQGNGGYVLTNNAQTANILVKPHSYKSFDVMIETEGGIEQGGFKLLGEIKKFGNGNRYFRSYREQNGKYLIIDSFFLLSDFNGGVLVLGLSTDNNSATEAFNGSIKLIETVSFYRPKQSEQGANLQNSFGGKKLTYFYTGNGYSESRKIWLCKSGSFFSQSESFSNSQLGSGSTASSSEGTWKVQTSGNSVYLVLNSNDGGQRSFEITARQASNEIGMNGNRYFVESHNECN